MNVGDKVKYRHKDRDYAQIAEIVSIKVNTYDKIEGIVLDSGRIISYNEDIAIEEKRK